MLLAIVYFITGLKIFGVNYTVQTAAIIAEGVVALMYAAHSGYEATFVSRYQM